jgi:hypothetical protein
LAPGVSVIKLFYSSLMLRQNKLECLSQPSPKLASKSRAYPSGAPRQVLPSSVGSCPYPLNNMLGRDKHSSLFGQCASYEISFIILAVECQSVLQNIFLFSSPTMPQYKLERFYFKKCFLVNIIFECKARAYPNWALGCPTLR